MASTSAFPAQGGRAGVVVTGELAAVLARLGELTGAAAADPTAGDRAADAARIDQIALLERIQAAAAATQAAMMVGFARSQVAAQQQAVLADPRAVGRGIADQLALACHVSPAEGSRRLGMARALYAGPAAELPATAALLRAGRISAYVAGLVVTETRHLDPDRRRTVDQQLAGDEGEAGSRGEGLAGCAPRKTRDQIMADTLVEPLTGRTTAADGQAEVSIVIPVDALIRPDAGDTAGEVAEVAGHGPIPAALAKDILAGSRGRQWWRRRPPRPRRPLRQPHTVATTTPTGHTYTSRAGPAP